MGNGSAGKHSLGDEMDRGATITDLLIDLTRWIWYGLNNWIKQDKNGRPMIGVPSDPTAAIGW